MDRWKRWVNGWWVGGWVIGDRMGGEGGLLIGRIGGQGGVNSG